MKKTYEKPELIIHWYQLTDVLADSNPTGWIPDTDDDDVFGDL